MKQMVIKKGKIIVENYTLPECYNDGVLVKTIYSAVSVGTELASLQGRSNLLITALKNPMLIKKVLDYAKKQGLSKAKNMVDSKLNVSSALGYSSVGEVIKVGKNIKDIELGDLVACAGAGFSNHAEVNYIPKNLFVKLPQNIDLKQVAYTTIASIALQGVRQADSKIGEIVVVYGLGLLGNIVMQILNANGVKAIGFDLDNKKINALKSKGFLAFNSKEESVQSVVDKYSEGYGTDSVIITAATKDNGHIINEAFDVCKHKGTVVLVGVVDLNIDRSKMYQKELTFKISTSYGPGRYDLKYEDNGIDYPYGYVRWTENRNMKEIVNLISLGKLDLSDFTKNIFKIEDVSGAFDKLKSRDLDHLLISYDSKLSKKDYIIELNTKLKDGKIKIGIVGVGNFVKSMHLPNIKKIPNFEIYAVCDANPINAKNIAEKFGATKIYSDYKDLLADKNVDLVFIGTRHINHGELVLKSLAVNKHVFIEKPLCLSNLELNKIKSILKTTKKILMVGHNRSFAPVIEKIKESSLGTKIIQYTVNAGYIPKDSWVQGEQGGGRIIGECVHFFDLFYYLTDSNIKKYSFNRISSQNAKYIDEDNFSINIEFENGDLANLIYIAMGSPNLAKENIKIYNEGNIFEVKDFTEVYDYNKNKSIYKGFQDKGHLKELQVIKDAIKTGDLTEVNFRLNNALKATKFALNLIKK